MTKDRVTKIHYDTQAFQAIKTIRDCFVGVATQRTPRKDDAAVTAKNNVFTFGEHGRV